MRTLRDPHHFNYHPNILSDLNHELKAIFKEEFEISKVPYGQQNYNFKLSKNGKALYYARVFSYFHIPLEKYSWIQEKLKQLQIPYSQIVFNCNESEKFPNGYIISEWLEGTNGQELITSGLLSYQEYIDSISNLLEKIHTVSLPGFGWINNEGKGQYLTFHDRFFGQNNQYDSIPDQINFHSVKELVGDSLDTILALFQKGLDRIEQPIEGILIHSDPSPANAIMLDNGVWTLVDWDDAESSWWIKDFVVLKYWSSFPSLIDRKIKEEGDKRGLSRVDQKLIELLESVRYSLQLSVYFKTIRKSENDFIQQKERLLLYAETLRKLIN